MAASAEARLRRFLLATAAVVYVGAAVELALVGHVEGALQLVPFGLVGAGLAAVLWVRASASAASVKTLRLVSAVVAAGSLWGIALHVKGNLEFEREVNPDLSLPDALWEAAQGVSPLLAPGTLALAAVLAAAATWHPTAKERAPGRGTAVEV